MLAFTRGIFQHAIAATGPATVTEPAAFTAATARAGSIRANQRLGGAPAHGQRRHRAVAMGGTLQQTALDDDVAGLVQIKRAAGPGGRDFPGAVADMGGGPNAKRPAARTPPPPGWRTATAARLWCGEAFGKVLAAEHAVTDQPSSGASRASTSARAARNGGLCAARPAPCRPTDCRCRSRRKPDLR